MAVSDPTLEIETSMHAAGARFVIGIDEVGRGAIAGPVAVGLCVVDVTVGAHPEGLRDSKLLSEKRRVALAPLTAEWAVHTSVGLASALEVDRIGIVAALGLAAKRGLVALHEAGADIGASVVLLDGSHDWLNPALSSPLRVQTRVKADRDCSSVAGASVVAKVHRDSLMIDADARQPGYGWAGNKGYGSADHFAAIAQLGATDLHRRTWLKTSV
ncbi:ribonuclease HII [Conyzicola sp.]|uniref:ribonuclease HII n=1 Tax=Conyzicola sp. TaxID=1969404 RepID=UPI00398A410B